MARELIFHFYFFILEIFFLSQTGSGNSRGGFLLQIIDVVVVDRIVSERRGAVTHDYFLDERSEPISAYLLHSHIIHVI